MSKTRLANAKRLVVKVGSALVTNNGAGLDLAAIGDWHKPKAQLLGFRGAPGNTISHATSYFVGNHSPKSLVEAVDVVSGVGYDRAAELGPETSRFHEIRRVVTNLCVIDFEATDATGVHCARLRSVHPWSSVDDVVAATGFELAMTRRRPRVPCSDRG